MKRKILIIIVLFYNIEIFAQHPSTDSNYELIFEDNFDTFDASRWWKMDAGWNCTPANNTFVGGKALLTHNLVDNSVWPPITSQGGLMTNARFFPGCYMECSAKIPRGKHPWPAFWTWEGDGACNSILDYREIDIMEWVGHATKSTANIHYCEEISLPPYRLRAYSENYYTVNDPFNFNTYACMWDRNNIAHVVNNNTVFEHRPPNRMFSNNMAISLGNGAYIDRVNVGVQDYPEDAVDVSNFPYTFEVDYVRVYRLRQNCDVIINEIPNFSTYTYSLKKAIYMSNATTIPLGSTQSLRAVDEIELRDGFEAPNNTTLYLNTNECY